MAPCGERLGQNIRLDQRGTFPARLEHERAVGGADRDRCRFEIGKSGVVSRECNGEMRFRDARVRLGQLDDQAEDRRLVGLRRQCLVELDERVAKRTAGRGVGEDVLEFRLQLVACARLRQRRDHLPRALRGRIERLPQLGGFERERALPRKQRDFGGPPREPGRPALRARPRNRPAPPARHRRVAAQYRRPECDTARRRTAPKLRPGGTAALRRRRRRRCRLRACVQPDAEIAPARSTTQGDERRSAIR